MNKQCKCTSCGYVFDIEDAGGVRENHWLDGEYMGSETFLVCPNCGGDFEDAADCCECGETFVEDEIYYGWCESCLRASINYDTFLAYCEAHRNENYLDSFVMGEFFGMDAPNRITDDFHELMLRVYREKVESARKGILLVGSSVDDFLEACIRVVMDDDGSIGRENYADWLNKRDGK